MSKRREVDSMDDNVIEPGAVQDEAMALTERWPAGCLQITTRTPPEQWPSSFEPGSKEFKAAVVNAALTPDVQVSNEWSKPFTVRDWVVMVRESIDDRTGEISQYPWVALFCDDGDIVGTSSEYAMHDLARALRRFTPEEWKEGIAFQIRAKKSRTGPGFYHQLRVAQ